MKNVIQTILIGVVLFNGAFAMAKSENFKLYLQGKVVDSIEMMNQELRKMQFTTRELNRMISRLNSAYETNLTVSTELYLKTLQKIENQSASQAMEMDAKLLHSEFLDLTTGPVSVDQVQNLINMTDRRYKGTQRSLRFLALKMLAHRIYLKTNQLTALYLAGVAGTYRFNTGTAELSQFVEICQNQLDRPACKDNFDAASAQLRLSEKMKLGNEK